jgi:hypothetical protein
VTSSDETAIESVSFAKERMLVGGHTRGADFGTQPLGSMYHTTTMLTQAPGWVNNWGHDGIIMAFESSTVLAYSTFFGGESGFWGEAVVTTAFYDDQFYLSGVTSKQTDPASYFPLHDAGGPPAYYDDAFDPALTNRLDGFVTVICTDELTSISETANTHPARFDLHRMPDGQWLIDGLPQGRYDLMIIDASGKVVQRDGRFLQGFQDMITIPGLANGYYSCMAIGDGASYAAKFIILP